MGKQVGVGWFKMIQVSEEDQLKKIQASEEDQLKRIQASEEDQLKRIQVSEEDQLKRIQARERHTQFKRIQSKNSKKSKLRHYPIL